MNVRFNQRMLELLGGDPEFLEMPLEELPSTLLARAATPLMEVSGCVVPAEAPSVAWVHNETGTECFWSEFKLQHYLAELTPLEEVARTALDFVWPLRKALKESNLSGKFRMIASIDLSSSLRQHASCSVRFHRLRSDQPWLAADLESYEEEAILVCDFNVPW